MLMFGLRLGTDPRVVVTITPRPIKIDQSGDFRNKGGSSFFTLSKRKGLPHLSGSRPRVSTISIQWRNRTGPARSSAPRRGSARWRLYPEATATAAAYEVFLSQPLSAKIAP